MDRQPSGPSWVSSDSCRRGFTRCPTCPVDVPGEHAQPHAELRCGQAGAGRGQHGVGEVLDEPAQLLVEVDDLDGGLAQDGVTEQADGLDGHGSSLQTGDSALSLGTAPSRRSRVTRSTADPPGCAPPRACGWSAAAAGRPARGTARSPARGAPAPRPGTPPRPDTTGPSTSAAAGAVSRVTASSTAPGAPVIVASREAGGRCAATRSALSRAAKPARSQRTSACSAGWVGVADRDHPASRTDQPGRVAPAAQRLLGGTQVGAAQQQPGVEQHDGGVAPGGDRLGARRGHHDLGPVVDLGHHAGPARGAHPACWRSAAELLRGPGVAEHRGAQPAVAALRAGPGRRRGGAPAAGRRLGRRRSAPAGRRRWCSAPASGSARRPATRRSRVRGVCTSTGPARRASRIVSWTCVGIRAPRACTSRSRSRSAAPATVDRGPLAQHARGAASSAAQPLRSEVLGLDGAREAADQRARPARARRAAAASRGCAGTARGARRAGRPRRPRSRPARGRAPARTRRPGCRPRSGGRPRLTARKSA